MAHAAGPGTRPAVDPQLAAASPIRRQYLELKRRRPDAVLFFRLGDFYATFDADAELVAQALDLALTSKDLGRGPRAGADGAAASAGHAGDPRTAA